MHHGDEGVGRPHGEETANHDEAHLGEEYIYIYFFFIGNSVNVPVLAAVDLYPPELWLEWLT